MINNEKNLHSLYHSKLMNPDDAIRKFASDLKFVTFGCYAATPVALSLAYANAAKAGLFKHPVDTYLFRSSPQVVAGFNDPEVLKSIHLILPFIGGEIGTLLQTARENLGVVQYPEYVSGHFSHMESGFLTQYGPPDLHMLQVSAMDKHGYFSFGLDGSFSIPAAREAKHILVEVNKNIPRTFGDGIIHLRDVDAVVEHDSDLLLISSKPAMKENNKIASYILDFISDGACIQLGIGGVPDAVGKYLEHKNDLGIHTELLCSSQIDLINNGNITNKHKNIHRYHTVFNVAMLPSQKYYDLMDNNPSMLCYPASYVNDPNVIRQIDNMISINSFIEIDLFGQVASESIHWKQLTGTGGQVDFVRGASAAKGGKSFLAAASTAKAGKISKIVPRLDNIVTTARTDVHYVVTEYGCVNLAGMSNSNRAKSLISLSHPDFREGLTASAKKMGLIH
ncbi:MAG: 4-hydroxybutyrate CoA-transferase [Desulfobacteraceae bacterium]|nr:4-hydroxybutyrate CoA-transferase [Desulfobacteraceae bacterium]